MRIKIFFATSILVGTYLLLSPNPSASLPNLHVMSTEDSRSKILIKTMLKFSWSNYKQYAFGFDYLKPLSKSHSNFHANCSLAFTLIDSIGTLHIMGMNEEINQTIDYLESVKRTIFNIDQEVDFFETTIRILGGLLSAFDLTGHSVLLELAEDIGKRLFFAFSTPNGFPDMYVNLKTGSHNSPSTVSLSNIGTHLLEFHRLSQHTKNPEFAHKSLNSTHQINLLIGTKLPVKGLYPTQINHGTAQIDLDPEYSLGAGSDSFYEYLVKGALMFDDFELDKMAGVGLEKLKKFLLRENEQKLMYFGNGRLKNLNSDMHHLTCFSGGLYALNVLSNRTLDRKSDLEVATGLTETCFQMYKRSPIALSPENVNMNTKDLNYYSNPSYMQRPETVESIFYMWRLTHDSKYRLWAMEIALAVEKETRVKHGYSGIKNIYKREAGDFTDLQDSYFLAETLKYLYLTFEDDEVLRLEEWVFNTQGHPLKIVK